MKYNIITALILIAVFAAGYYAGTGKEDRRDRKKLKKEYNRRPRAVRR